MPTYEYHCPTCKKSYELRESFSAEARHTCQECGKGTAKRVLHAPRVVFKGSGFYATDSRNRSTATDDGGPSEKSEKSAAAEPVLPAASKAAEKSSASTSGPSSDAAAAS